MTVIAKKDRKTAIAAEQTKRVEATKNNSDGKNDGVTQLEAPKQEVPDKEPSILAEQPDDDERILAELEKVPDISEEKVQEMIGDFKSETDKSGPEAEDEQETTEDEMATETYDEWEGEVEERLDGLDETVHDIDERVHHMEAATKELRDTVKDLLNFKGSVAQAVKATLEVEVSRVVSDKIMTTWYKKFKELGENVVEIMSKYNQIAEVTLYIEALKRLDKLEPMIEKAEKAAEKAERAKIMIFDKIDKKVSCPPAKENRPDEDSLG